MRVLFVCSGNRGISPIITAQAESLSKSNVTVEIKPIIGKGILGYLSNIGDLRKEIKRIQPDIVHAHYSFCGIVAALATSKPVVTSLMGSDVIHSGIWRWMILFWVKLLWAATIVKSEDMKTKLGISGVIILPNGVDLDRFCPLDKDECRRQLGWSESGKIVLFASDPKRLEKNYELAVKAIDLLNQEDVELKVVHGVPQTSLPLYYNAADVVLLTSRWEGSPNTVKEAMACNVPVVATKVGDIPYLFGEAKGYYIADQTEEEIGHCLIMALKTDGVADGREQILSLRLDSESISCRLSVLYQANVI